MELFLQNHQLLILLEMDAQRPFCLKQKWKNIPSRVLKRLWYKRIIFLCVVKFPEIYSFKENEVYLEEFLFWKTAQYPVCNAESARIFFLSGKRRWILTKVYSANEKRRFRSIHTFWRNTQHTHCCRKLITIVTQTSKYKTETKWNKCLLLVVTTQFFHHVKSRIATN